MGRWLATGGGGGGGVEAACVAVAPLSPRDSARLWADLTGWPALNSDTGGSECDAVVDHLLGTCGGLPAAIIAAAAALTKALPGGGHLCPKLMATRPVVDALVDLATAASHTDGPLSGLAAHSLSRLPTQLRSALNGLCVHASPYPVSLAVRIVGQPGGAQLQATTDPLHTLHHLVSLGLLRISAAPWGGGGALAGAAGRAHGARGWREGKEECVVVPWGVAREVKQLGGAQNTGALDHALEYASGELLAAVRMYCGEQYTGGGDAGEEEGEGGSRVLGRFQAEEQAGEQAGEERECGEGQENCTHAGTEGKKERAEEEAAVGAEWRVGATALARLLAPMAELAGAIESGGPGIARGPL
ncbi:hypothetical protein FOA52_002327 [Chlamydomonas sp. UWO 241]|nr:hypothetical protein FOA52_002327 [Chlamydomonas sp. UWO 241]